MKIFQVKSLFKLCFYNDIYMSFYIEKYAIPNDEKDTILAKKKNTIQMIA